jgi:threonine dehydratase
LARKFGYGPGLWTGRSTLEAKLDIADVRAAAERIAGAVVRTPTMHSKTLSAISGAEIWLKFENQQFTAAYKERGALNALLLLTEEQRSRGVIAASAATTHRACRTTDQVGVPVTIVMPRTTPTVKVLQTEAVGGKVVLEGETFDEAYEYARSMERQLGLTFVHPFDDPDVAAGKARSRSRCSRTRRDRGPWSCRSGAAD